MAKLFASEMAGRVADRAVQIFGGRGYMTENPAERYYRELRVDRIWEGTSEIQRVIIARGLLKRGVAPYAGRSRRCDHRRAGAPTCSRRGRHAAGRLVLGPRRCAPRGGADLRALVAVRRARRARGASTGGSEGRDLGPARLRQRRSGRARRWPKPSARFRESSPRGGVDVGELRFRERVEWEIPANWKVAIENYLECYHCPVAHPGFSKVMDVDPDAYLLRSHGVCSTQLAPVKESARSGKGPATWRTARSRRRSTTSSGRTRR